MAKAGVSGRIVGGRSANDYTIIVAYDGERTEDEYFRGWKLIIPGSRLSLVPIFVKSGGNPLHAVRQARKEQKNVGDYAEFWCVSDCDDAPEADIAKAREEALRWNIRLCLSNRCFEVWILLHFERLTRPVNSARDAIAMVGEYEPAFSEKNKSVSFSKLLPLTPTALEHAVWLAGQGFHNPYTNVHGLVKKLRENLPPKVATHIVE
jgi:hypothetical protein